MQLNDFRAILTRHPRRLASSRLWTHIAGDVVLWTTIVLLRHSLPWWHVILTAPLFAAATFRAFGMMHECVHACGSERRSINNALGFVYGVICFLPFANWRSMHIDHHMWTGNVDKDPTTKILLKFEHDGFHTSRIVDWTWRHWVPLFGFMQHVVFWQNTVNRREYKFLASSVIYLGVVAYLAGPLTLIAGILCYLILVESVNLPHHLGMTQHRGENRFPTYEQDRFARSCVYPKWFANLVLLNFNFHAEHHMFPAHPWYQLDEIHEDIAKSFGGPLNSSEAHEWMSEARAKQLDDVLRLTFAPPAERASG